MQAEALADISHETALDLLNADGVHLGPAGNRAYTRAASAILRGMFGESSAE